MGLLDCNGDVNADAVNFLAHLCAGLFFDALCDSYVEMQTVSRICQAFCKSENVEAQRVVLMICSEYDDVYQQLALRLIRAVAGFDPQKGILQQHIFAQLKYELLNCKSACRLCGLTGAPKEYCKSDMVSLDHISESSSLYEQVMAA